MQFSDERIDEFIRLYEQACGEHLSREGARIRAAQLLELYRVITQPSGQSGSAFGAQKVRAQSAP